MRTRIRRYQTVRIERHLCRWVEHGRRCSKAGGEELAQEIEARLNRVEIEEIPFVDFSSVHIFTRTNPKSTTYQLCWREKGKRVFFSLGKGATQEFAEAMRRIKAGELEWGDSFNFNIDLGRKAALRRKEIRRLDKAGFVQWSPFGVDDPCFHTEEVMDEEIFYFKVGDDWLKLERKNPQFAKFKRQMARTRIRVRDTERKQWTETLLPSSETCVIEREKEKEFVWTPSPLAVRHLVDPETLAMVNDLYDRGKVKNVAGAKFFNESGRIFILFKGKRFEILETMDKSARYLYLKAKCVTDSRTRWFNLNKISWEEVSEEDPVPKIKFTDEERKRARIFNSEELDKITSWD